MKFLRSSSLLALVTAAVAYPSHMSLAGLSREQLDAIVPTLTFTPPPPPPPPMNYTGIKLVNDADHPFQPLQPGDQRGPCPALNTLASHGYLPRNGITTPNEIIDAIQEGFNLDYHLARFLAFAGFLVDGNMITNKISIGAKTPLTGPDVSPITAGGLDTHEVFEGDTSMTRLDFYFGNNHDFNEELFDQFIDFSNRYGAGKYNLTVAGKLREQRIMQSIAENPDFTFVSPRYFTAYTESAFPFQVFVDGRFTPGELDMDAARNFFQLHQFPDDFHRAATPQGSRAGDIYNEFMFNPGSNTNGTNSFVEDPTSASFQNFCLFYTNYVTKTVKGLYPNPTGDLLTALNINLGYYYEAFIDANPGIDCPQQFPYGMPASS